jgi:transcriptional regulator with XRE-family HTH domain
MGGKIMELGQKIRGTREKFGMSLRKLARTIGVSPSFISQVEQGKAQPSVDSLQKIARTLEVSCSFLLSEDNQSISPVTIAKKKGAPKLIQGVEAQVLVSKSKLNNLDPTLLTIKPGATSKTDANAEDGEQFVLLLKGQLEMDVDGKKYILKEGDNMHFKSNVAHQFKNSSNSATKALWVRTYV